MKRWPLLTSFVLFIALCVSATYWGMQLLKPPARPVAAPPPAVQAPPDPRAAAVLFGGRQGPVAVATNYQLRGVVSSGTSGESVAILSADGKPPEAVRANREFQPGVVIKEVHPRYVLLQENGVMKRVELLDEAKGGMMADTGSRPPVTRAVPPPPGMQQPQMQPQSAPMPPPQVQAVPEGAAPMQGFGSPMGNMPR
ncbi:type II secretion system protein N [Noviherbaspirillum soli]|uniref:type II secretion system protein N n=1 Tax=Noviherbaspirillum soli TaxID=1064518 RepID=UPI00188BB4FD|nr:type II secretion system protein N [Noviherbaspirillum soli]